MVLTGLLLAADDAPARRLPPVVTVCRTPATRTCWTETGESRCARGVVFRIVIEGADVNAALADCRAPAEPARSQ